MYIRDFFPDTSVTVGDKAVEGASSAIIYTSVIL